MESLGLMKTLNARGLTPHMRAEAEAHVKEMRGMLKQFHVESMELDNPVIRASALAAHRAIKAFLVTCMELKIKKKR